MNKTVRTLFLLTVNGASEDELQHPSQLGGVGVFPDHVEVWESEVIDLLAQNLDRKYNAKVCVLELSHRIHTEVTHITLWYTVL